MSVIEIVLWSVWYLYYAFIVGLMVYFWIVEPLYKAIKNLIKACRSEPRLGEPTGGKN